MRYGPKLTSKIKRQLEQEIKNFDKKQTLREIEQNSIGQPDVDAYGNWVRIHGEEYRANPDLLSEDEAIQFGKFESTPEIEQAKQDIYHLFSPREKQVWRYSMREGLSERETAEQLHISQQAVHQYLAKAKGKVERYFKHEK